MSQTRKTRTRVKRGSRTAADSVLRRLEQIRGVRWEWNEEAAALGFKPGTREAGVLPQELELVFPDLIVEIDGVKQVSYSGLVAVLLEAVKELGAETQRLQSRVRTLERALRRARGDQSAGSVG